MATPPVRKLRTPLSDSVKRYAPTGTRTTHKLPAVIISLLVVLVASMTAAVVILLTSHEDPVQIWKIRPSVWLSVLAGVYVIALAGLFSTGVAVMWWRCIAHGTTLERLHYVHAGANPKDVVSAFLAGGYARRVAVVAVVVFTAKLSAGPLLQRSTRPVPHSAARDVEMSIDIALEIPDGWFGTEDTFGGQGIVASQATFFGFNLTTDDTTAELCPGPGICDAYVDAAGLNLWNATDVTTLDLLDRANTNRTLFSINLTMNNDFGIPMLYLETEFVSSVDEHCMATVTREIYGMIPAIMRYPIIIQDDRFTPDIQRVIDNPIIIANYSSPLANGTTDVLRGILGAIQPIYLSKAVLDVPTNGNPPIYTLLFEERLNSFWTDIFFTGAVLTPDIPANCSLRWTSPTQYVLQQILGFNFRSARMAAARRNYEPDKQTFTAVYTGTELWYTTDFKWLTGALAIMLSGVVAALSLVWGWWQLDRYVTLSPLETGKALGAPILVQAGPENEANSILREVGRELVAYDDDELIWAGSLYTTAVRTSPRGGATPPSRTYDDTGPYLDHNYMQDVYLNEHQNARPHRRGPRSMNEADPIRVTRTFEHGRGYTTRRPYEGEEEEVDIGHYGHEMQWRNEQPGDRVPLIQMLSNIVAPADNVQYEGVPRSAPVPSPTSSQVRSLGARKKKARRASVRSSLPSIEERNTPTPEGEGNRAHK